MHWAHVDAWVLGGNKGVVGTPWVVQGNQGDHGR